MPEEKSVKNNPAPRGAENVGLRVSLMPEEIKAVDPAARFRMFVLIVSVGFAVLFIGTGALWGVVYFKRAEAQAAAQNLAKAQNDLTGIGVAYDAAKKEQDKINVAGELFKAHLYPSRVFDLLQQDVLPKVSLITLNFTSSGALAITGTAADYETLVAQVETIKNDPAVRSVSFSGVNGNFDEKKVLEGVNFNLNVVLDPSFLVNAQK
jgi:hypothetical protein